MEPIGIVERLGRWSSGRGALYLLLAARIRALIDDGEVPAGAALPPDRALASALAVGRSTVVAAYGLLAAEGRIVRRRGSGTRVAGRATRRATRPGRRPRRPASCTCSNRGTASSCWPAPRRTRHRRSWPRRTGK